MSRATLPTADVSRPPFALGEPLVTVIDLPAPPSVNRTRKIDWKAGKKFKGWTREADGLVLAARCRTHGTPLRKMPGRFELLVVLSEAHTRIDLDNGLKWLIDYLRRVQLIVDDSPKYMRRLVVELGHAPAGCRLTITELP